MNTKADPNLTICAKAINYLEQDLNNEESFVYKAVFIPYFKNKYPEAPDYIHDRARFEFMAEVVSKIMVRRTDVATLDFYYKDLHFSAAVPDEVIAKYFDKEKALEETIAGMRVDYPVMGLQYEDILEYVLPEYYKNFLGRVNPSCLEKENIPKLLEKFLIGLH